MTGLFLVQKDVISSKTCQFYKKQYFYNPIRVSLAILMQIKKKNCFCSSSKFAVVLVRAAKKHAAGEWLQCRHFEIFVNDKISLETYIHGQIHPQSVFSYYLSFNPEKKCPKIYAVTLVLPLKTQQKCINKMTLSSGTLML